MKARFKLPLLMLITSVCLSAQQQDIYKNSFDAENLRTLVLDLNSSYIQIEESDDGKVYIDYTINFNNYSKKQIKEILDKIETSAVLENEKLVLKSDSQSTMGDVVYSIETLFGITFEGNNINFKESSTRMFRKGKQYFMDINDGSRIKSLKEYLKNIREFDGKKKKKKVKIKNVKSYRTSFIIKIPSRVSIKATAINSNMIFKLDLKNQMTLNARNTKLQFQGLSNELNNFDIVNGEFRANALKGGTYKFNHVSKAQFSEIRDVNIDSEFTDIQIGEVGENVNIIDFNSKFWIHNFSQDFGSFNMNTEYSEINMFFPEDMKYYIETYGFDTVHYYAKLITEIPPSRKKESSKMMIIGKDDSPNRIQINTIHGIVRFGEDFIDYGE